MAAIVIQPLLYISSFLVHWHHSNKQYSWFLFLPEALLKGYGSFPQWAVWCTAKKMGFYNGSMEVLEFIAFPLLYINLDKFSQMGYSSQLPNTMSLTVHSSECQTDFQTLWNVAAGRRHISQGLTEFVPFLKFSCCLSSSYLHIKRAPF